jgi:twitching motility two-component system response regulator PilH
LVIADDHRDTVLTLTALLRDEGHDVRGVYHGEDALAALRRDMPDALIVDIDMPGKSGFAVAQEVRQTYGKHAPLMIAMSGKWTGQTDKMLGRLVGFDHYCLKPCEPLTLLQLLEPLTRASQ